MATTIINGLGSILNDCRLYSIETIIIFIFRGLKIKFDTLNPNLMNKMKSQAVVFALMAMTFFYFGAYGQEHVPKSIYDFRVDALNGGTIDFSKFKGKKILIVNTTTIATDNPQYAELESLSKKYKDNLVVVGFLAIDFLKIPGGKRDFSPRDASEYKVTFPLAAQVRLSGRDIAPIYKWLTDVNYNKFKSTEIKWDFQKYLVNENGELVAEFDPNTRVTDPKVIQAIEK